jgi:hypothetical protein
MVYQAEANPQGPYWAEEWNPREYCYSIIPIKDKKPENVTAEVWKKIFFMVGELGYLFRDAGHDIQHAVISLNKAITQEDLKKLEGKLRVSSNNGSELAFV